MFKMFKSKTVITTQEHVGGDDVKAGSSPQKTSTLTVECARESVRWKASFTRTVTKPCEPVSENHTDAPAWLTECTQPWAKVYEWYFDTQDPYFFFNYKNGQQTLARDDVLFFDVKES
jgi:hypothetical protein